MDPSGNIEDGDVIIFVGIECGAEDDWGFPPSSSNFTFVYVYMHNITICVVYYMYYVSCIENVIYFEI